MKRNNKANFKTLKRGTAKNPTIEIVVHKDLHEVRPIRYFTKIVKSNRYWRTHIFSCGILAVFFHERHHQSSLIRLN